MNHTTNVTDKSEIVEKHLGVKAQLGRSSTLIEFIVETLVKVGVFYRAARRGAGPRGRRLHRPPPTLGTGRFNHGTSAR